MDETIIAFVDFMQGHQRASHNTCGAYGTDLRQLSHFLQEHRILRWKEIGSEHLVAYLLRLREEQYASTSIARKLAAMKSFFHWLVETGQIPTDPTVSLSAPRVDRETHAAVTTDALATLMKLMVANDPIGLRDRAMLQLLCTTGMRVTEIVSLDVSDLDFEHQTVLCVGGQGKHARRRMLPLDPDTVTTLRAFLDLGRSRLAPNKKELSLFVNHHGTRLTRQGFWLIIKTHARSAGMAEVTPHSLRHAFAMHLIDHGTELSTVKELLGHASISTTQMYRGRSSRQRQPVTV